MAKLIALAIAGQPHRKVWIHPDAVQQLSDTGTGNTTLQFRSGAPSITLGGSPDTIASKLNSASE